MKFLSAYGECHIAANGREAVEACQMALDANEPKSSLRPRDCQEFCVNS
jgi:hypothetical protein